MKLTPLASKAARGLLGWSLHALRERSSVSMNSVLAFERGDPVSDEVRQKIAEAFDAAGVELLGPTRPGARMKAPR